MVVGGALIFLCLQLLFVASCAASSFLFFFLLLLLLPAKSSRTFPGLPRWFLEETAGSVDEQEERKEEPTLGDGWRPVGHVGYGGYLRGVRRAARVCCGFSREQSLELRTQSGRSGGDTAGSVDEQEERKEEPW